MKSTDLVVTSKQDQDVVEHVLFDIVIMKGNK